MKKHRGFILFLMVCMSLAAVPAFAQKANEGNAQLEKKIDTLTKQVAALETKLDLMISRQDQIAAEMMEELRKVKIWINRRG